MSAPTRGELDRLVWRAGRRVPITRPEAWRAITALAGELDRLRAERDKVVSALEKHHRADRCMCYLLDDGEKCGHCRDADLLAMCRLKGTP